ncbi:MAG: hypothetical protein JW837_05585 [Sedimentisphaerales bacterium]|nr:hypothetical protein [Sedimentisphaerales bacterium]
MPQDTDENKPSIRLYWRNCDTQGDSEVIGIDEMEDSVTPLGEDMIKIRQLISGFELCYHESDNEADYIAEAIGGDLHPARPYACHSRNVNLSPLLDRMRIISNTLGFFWKYQEKAGDIDNDILVSLGQLTPVKRWLAASLDKTIRLYLEASSDFWLMFG